MNLSPALTTSLWIASKGLAFLGIMLCFIPGQWSLVTFASSAYIEMKNTLPVTFFCLAALVGIAAWILEAQRLTSVSH
jgi:hypothetical protein